MFSGYLAPPVAQGGTPTYYGQCLNNLLDFTKAGLPQPVIPDTGTVVPKYIINGWEDSSNRITWVSVYVELTHPRINDLIISVTSPVGWPSTYGYYAGYTDMPGQTKELYNRNCAVGQANMATWFEDNGPNILTSSSCNINTGYTGTSSRASSQLMTITTIAQLDSITDGLRQESGL